MDPEAQSAKNRVPEASLQGKLFLANQQPAANAVNKGAQQQLQSAPTNPYADTIQQQTILEITISEQTARHMISSFQEENYVKDDDLLYTQRDARNQLARTEILRKGENVEPTAKQRRVCQQRENYLGAGVDQPESNSKK